MSNFQRILNMASKALGTSGQSANGSGNADWREVVRAAADKVTGDSRPSVAPSPSTPATRPAPAPRSAPASQPAPSAARPATHPAPSATQPAPSAVRPATQPATSADAAAIARYDYLLKTAQPEQLEQVHRDAFARLTPAQRAQVEAQLRAELPATEQPVSAEPVDLARAATRAEAHKPGFLRSLFAKSGGRGGAGVLAGAGVGAVAGAGLGAAGGLLAAVAGGAVLSSVAAPILEQAAGLGVDFESLAGDLTAGVEDYAGGLGDLATGAEDYVGGLGDLATGAEDYVGGVGEQVTELGSSFDTSALTDAAANFEIPGLSDLGRFFGRES